MKYVPLTLVVMIAPTLAWAADDDNLFAGSIWQSVAALVAFVLLLAVLSKYAWGPMLQSLQDREDRIRKSIADAEKQSADAAVALAEYQKQLAQARQETQRIVDEARDNARKLSAQMNAENQVEINRMKDKAASDIQRAKEYALSEIYIQTAELTTQVAAQILKREINQQDQEKLVEDSINQFKASRN